MKRPTLGILLFMLLNPAANAQEKLDIRPRFNKGESHTVTVTLDQTISQTRGEKKLTSLQMVQIGYTVTVDDVDDRGIATLSLRYDSVRFDASGAAGQITYDSQQPNGTTQVGIGALVGQSFQATISPIGVVQNVRGLDRLLAASVSQITLDEGPLRQAVEKTLRQQLDPANVKPFVQNLFGVLPNHPVATGDTWPKQIEIHAGPTASVDANYALKARDNGIAIISLTGHAATAQDANIDAALTTVSYDLSGPIDGELQVQESSGWTWLATLNQTLSGAVTLKARLVDKQTTSISVVSKLKIEQK